jgi:hypothetical protein
MTKGARSVLAFAGFLLGLLVILFFTTTGFYCVVPSAGSPGGSTYFFVRRATPYRFIESADAIAKRQGLIPSALTRAELDGEFRRFTAGKILARFGFSRSLYLRSTGNIDFYSPPKPRATSAPADSR